MVTLICAGQTGHESRLTKQPDQDLRQIWKIYRFGMLSLIDGATIAFTFHHYTMGEYHRTSTCVEAKRTSNC